uniref:DUF4218 domain-containing protein n=1 Tax=Panagrolaimus sp. PS1159 TaxID=55785 RepID=A0AC35GQS4_9BILA
MTINLTSIKAFIKKCSLSKTISQDEIEAKYADINYYFTGKENDTITGLQFHAFLHFLFHLAKIKFGFCDDLLSSMQRFLAYCDAALRHYGIRSGRLRRTEIESDENANHSEIYLLPNRIRYHKSSATSLPNVGGGNHSKSKLFGNSSNNGILGNKKPLNVVQNQIRAKSLPRRKNLQSNSILSTTQMPNITSNSVVNGNINLPKIGIVH